MTSGSDLLGMQCIVTVLLFLQEIGYHNHSIIAAATSLFSMLLHCTVFISFLPSHPTDATSTCVPGVDVLASLASSALASPVVGYKVLL